MRPILGRRCIGQKYVSSSLEWLPRDINTQFRIPETGSVIFLGLAGMGKPTKIRSHRCLSKARTQTGRAPRTRGQEYGSCDSRRPSTRRGEYRTPATRGLQRTAVSGQWSKKLCSGGEEACTRTTEHEYCQVRLECSQRGHQCDTNVPGNGGARGRGALGIASVAVPAPALSDIRVARG